VIYRKPDNDIGFKLEGRAKKPDERKEFNSPMGKVKLFSSINKSSAA
jgi:hypothetical protein